MKKLKTILKYNKYILVFIIFFSLILTKYYKINSKYDINTKTIYGYVREINDNKITIFSKEKIILYLNHNINLQYNDYVKVEGNLIIPSKNTIFNSFNYKEYLNNKKIFYIMKVNDIKIVKKNNNIFYRIKNFIYNRINSKPNSSYLKVFILGDKSSLDNKEIYSNLGIMHLFCISGMHISILCLFLNKIVNKFKYKNIIIYFIFLFFIFLTNYQISIIRSCLSKLFSNINTRYKLNVSSKDRLILIVIFLLLINPYYINNIGFRFSTLISYSIINYSYLLKNKNYFFKTIIISFVSFITSIPLLINTYFSVNFLSIILNIIYVPIVTFIIFPLSIINLFIPIDNIYNNIICIFNNISIFINNIKIFTLSFSKISIILIIIYYLILFTKNNYKYFIIILITIFYLLNIYILNPRVFFIDVGQGDSSLVRYKNKNILIDTGGNIYRNLSKDNIIFFKSIGVKKIDYLIITHGDYDHMGEAINLVNNFKVEKVIFNCGAYNDLEKELIKVLDKKHIKYYSCLKELNVDKNKLYFLQTKVYDNENDNSNVIYTELKGYKFMFMGDASIKIEKEILNKYNLPKIDVLKAGHHGSKTSSSKEFVDEINPKYSVISVGKNNRYGHPNKEALENLENSKIYRTDQDGSIMFMIKNNKLNLETCRL